MTKYMEKLAQGGLALGAGFGLTVVGKITSTLSKGVAFLLGGGSLPTETGSGNAAQRLVLTSGQAPIVIGAGVGLIVQGIEHMLPGCKDIDLGGAARTTSASGTKFLPYSLNIDGRILIRDFRMQNIDNQYLKYNQSRFFNRLSGFGIVVGI